MSPWVNLGPGRAGRWLRYVFSRKPNPAVLAEDTWRPELARQQLRDFLDRAHGCRIEIIMKDVSTVRYQPQRLWEWEQIAMAVVQAYEG